MSLKYFLEIELIFSQYDLICRCQVIKAELFQIYLLNFPLGLELSTSAEFGGQREHDLNNTASGKYYGGNAVLHDYVMQVFIYSPHNYQYSLSYSFLPLPLSMFFSCFSAETAWQWGYSIYGFLFISFKVDWWLFSIDQQKSNCYV